MRFIHFTTVAFMMLLVSVTAAPQAAEPGAAVAPASQWPKEVIELAATIPIQDGGRVKPLDTYARFKLLQFSGRYSAKDAAGATKTHIEWLLDALFFPDTARQYKSFLIESKEVMQALSIQSEKARDRFSYVQLEPTREELFRLAQQYSRFDEKQRTPAQTQLINLAHNLFEFEGITTFMNFARHSLKAPTGPYAAVFDGKAAIALSDLIEKAEPLFAAVKENAASESAQTGSPDMESLRVMLQDAEHAAGTNQTLALFPPSDAAANHTEWMTPSELLAVAFEPPYPLTRQVDLIRKLEHVEERKANMDQFKVALYEFTTASVQLATARGEYKRIPLEITYYKGNYFLYSTYLYVIAFLLASVLWMRPQSRALAWVTGVTLTVPLILHTTGIVMRCIIRNRPPVTTLYETIIFIAAVAVFVSLCMEIMNRRRIGLSIGSFMGAVGLFLATKYEIIERVDTMPSLIAVLDTNFWLSTHVTTVTIGYSAGMLSGAVAHVYLLGKAFGLKKGAPDFYKSVSRMTYGVLCFGLLFSTLGTVLGGIWANDSWGRFWGWDPKENGALMICLWELAVLHLRMGGHIRDFGVNMAAVFNAIVVGFSWFGVNLLGVGLHSYGFTSGVARSLMIFYVIEGVILTIGAFVWLRENGIISFAWASRQPSATPGAAALSDRKETYAK